LLQKRLEGQGHIQVDIGLLEHLAIGASVHCPRIRAAMPRVEADERRILRLRGQERRGAKQEGHTSLPGIGTGLIYRRPLRWMRPVHQGGEETLSPSRLAGLL
jgi:hypothetical protein